MMHIYQIGLHLTLRKRRNTGTQHLFFESVKKERDQENPNPLGEGGVVQFRYSSIASTFPKSS